MLVRALTAGGGGGLSDFEILGFIETDRSLSATIPSDTDFIIVGSFWIQPYNDNIYRNFITFSSDSASQMGILRKVGDSINQTKSYNTYQSREVAVNQTTTWTNQTTVTVVKTDNYMSGVFIMPCKYK